MDSLIALAGEWDNVTMVENIDQAHVIANVDAALALGLPELTVQPVKDTPLSIMGGGPSLADTLPERRGDVWALNGVHDYLLSHGITPDGTWCVDSRVDNVRFFRKPQQGCAYYIASRCDLAVFTALQRHNVILWHDATCRKLVPGGKLIVSGGTTIGMKALAGAYACGYREIHLFGYDSSYRDTDHHAYSMPMNDGETVLTVDAAGRTFRAAPWMINQAKNFGVLAPLLQAQGVALHIHGDGMLPWIATSGHRLEQAA